MTEHLNAIIICSQTNTPGKSSSDELGEAREARPFRKRNRDIFNEIIILSQTNRPGRSSSDELGEAREVRPFNEK